MIRERIEIDLKPHEKSIKKQYPFLNDTEVKDLAFELYKLLENRYHLEVESIEN
ncbi:MAG: hypothetical protein PHS49_00585 [Candidatus Gracilibacteria bacterium]|nr:hypothetical protein [Candidatus Gracilibacteria bacterium]